MEKTIGPSDRPCQNEEKNVLHQYVWSPRSKDIAVFKSLKNADSAKISIFNGLYLLIQATKHIDVIHFFLRLDKLYQMV